MPASTTKQSSVRDRPTSGGPRSNAGTCARPPGSKPHHVDPSACIPTTRRRWRAACARPSPTAASRSATARRSSSSPSSTGSATGTRSSRRSRQTRPAIGRSGPVIPVLRIFDVAKAREFYGGFLGFAIDWEHTFDDHSPVYLQASREGAVLHLSEHHGDATPGATVRILVADVMHLHRELRDRDYPYARPVSRPRRGDSRSRSSTRSPTSWSSTSPSARSRPRAAARPRRRSSTSTTIACTPEHAFNVFTRGSGSGGTPTTRRPA